MFDILNLPITKICSKIFIPAKMYDIKVGSNVQHGSTTGALALEITHNDYRRFLQFLSPPVTKKNILTLYY